MKQKTNGAEKLNRKKRIAIRLKIFFLGFKKKILLALPLFVGVTPMFYEIVTTTMVETMAKETLNFISQVIVIVLIFVFAETEGGYKYSKKEFEKQCKLYQENLEKQDKLHQENLEKQDKLHQENLEKQDKLHQEIITVIEKIQQGEQKPEDKHIIVKIYDLLPIENIKKNSKTLRIFKMLTKIIQDWNSSYSKSQ